MIRILITDDHPFVRQGIRQILEGDREKRFGFIEEAENGSEMMEKIRGKDFDVIILDISLPGRSELDLLADLRKFKPKTAVVMLSMFAEEIYAIKAMKLGASAYITKTAATNELIKAIVKVRNGGRYITDSLAQNLSFNFLDEKDKPASDLLSARELEVVRMLSTGKTITAIAEELSLSPKTISTYRERILSKLNLKTTSEIIRFGLREGLV